MHTKKASADRPVFLNYPFSLASGLLIAILSLIPGDQLPESDIKYLDIVVHVGMYGTWIIIFARENLQFSVANSRYNYVAALLFVIFGGVIELLQEFLVLGRYGTWSDFFANAMGCLLGLIIARMLFRMDGKKSKS